MKRIYKEPKFEISILNDEDVITLSEGNPKDQIPLDDIEYEELS